MRHLWEALRRAYDALRFDEAAGGRVFWQLALARIIEPTSKQDALRVQGLPRVQLTREPGGKSRPSHH